MQFIKIFLTLATICLANGVNSQKSVRSEKSLTDEAAALSYEMSIQNSDRGNKRVPSGFIGTRGKKDVDLDEIVKRSISGFQGMRGKKEYELYDPPYDPYLEKRVPNSGFFGMRGKKDYELTSVVDEKRAPNSGFFGMRGKKQPGRSGFFGMRGKKYPYEIRGKFVGVRGKKDSQENIPQYETNNVRSVDGGLDINQLMLLLTENGAFSPERETGYVAQTYPLN